jgi:Domain of unknown function (DUF397)
VTRSWEDVPGKSVSAPEVINQNWRKSTRSIGNGQCVEVARLADGFLAIRDSMDRYGPTIRFSPGEWHTFLDGIKRLTSIFLAYEAGSEAVA